MHTDHVCQVKNKLHQENKQLKGSRQVICMKSVKYPMGKQPDLDLEEAK